MTDNVFKEIVDAYNDELRKNNQFKTLVKGIRDEMAESLSDVSNGLLVPNDDAETELQRPWLTASIIDIAAYAPAYEDVPELRIDDIVSHEGFLTALADPTVGESNLFHSMESDNNISNMFWDSEDPLMEIAENRSPTGLATTTLHVATEDGSGSVPIHIVMNNFTKKALIVGDSISEYLNGDFTVSETLSREALYQAFRAGVIGAELNNADLKQVRQKLIREAFNRVSIIYVDRNAETAEADIETALDSVMSRGKVAPCEWHDHLKELEESLGQQKDFIDQLKEQENSILAKERDMFSSRLGGMGPCDMVRLQWLRDGQDLYKQEYLRLQNDIDQLKEKPAKVSLSELKDAFGYRNRIWDDSRPLSALLADKSIEQPHPKYVVKSSKPAL